MIKIIAISDTHLAHNQVEIPECDLLIHAGDFSYTGKMIDIMEVNQWFGKLKRQGKVKEIISICGNHDHIGQTNSNWVKETFTNCIYLDEDSCEVFGYKVFGSAWTPFFNNWAFNAQRGNDIARHWAKIPKDTQILITHGGPMGILDECPDMDDPSKLIHVGCEELLKVVKKIKPLYHFYGHVHEDGGKQVTIDGTTFVNCSVLDGQYKLVNKPISIILK